MGLGLNIGAGGIGPLGVNPIAVSIHWDSKPLERALHKYGEAHARMADRAMHSAANIAAGHARSVAKGRVSGLIEVRSDAPGEFAVVVKKISGTREAELGNIREYGTLSKRVKKHRVKEVARNGRTDGLRREGAIHKGRTAARKAIPELLTRELMEEGRKAGFSMSRL